MHGAYLVGALLFLIGVGYTAWSANSNAALQLAAPDRLRGRIIGLYFYARNGTGPLGGLMPGWLCDRGGTELAFVIAGIAGVGRYGRRRRGVPAAAANALDFAHGGHAARSVGPRGGAKIEGYGSVFPRPAVPHQMSG